MLSKIWPNIVDRTVGPWCVPQNLWVNIVYLSTINDKNSRIDMISFNLFDQLLMRQMDQALARQLLSLRHEIQDIRLRWSCEDHKTLVEDIRIELEELQYLGEITDVPVHLLEFHNPLKHWGVTKLNIHNKRFSTCWLLLCVFNLE